MNYTTIVCVLYVAVYMLNLLFIVINLLACFSSRGPSLSFASQLNFAGWGLPAVVVISALFFLVDSGLIKFNIQHKINRK